MVKDYHTRRTANEEPYCVETPIKASPVSAGASLERFAFIRRLFIPENWLQAV